MRKIRQRNRTLLERKIQKLRTILLFLLIFPLLTSCNLGYLIKQGYGQIKLLSLREPIEEVLEDREVESRLKEKIRLVQEVKIFCEKALGLEVSGSYKSFVNVKGSAIAHVVSASPKDKLEPYEWHFPIIGDIPYKGFFDQEDALREKARLDDMGYDTLMQGVLAYSTLGWLGDPILSTMTRLNDVSLVYIIIHELTHQTLFLKDHVDFNERVATFIGHIGTILFIEQKKGKDSKKALLARQKFEDKKTFSRFIMESIERLESLYSMEISRQEKLKRRKRLFAAIISDFEKTRKRLKTSSYNSFGSEGLNNAVFLAHKRYIGHLDDLNRVYSCVERDPQNLIDLLLTFRSQKKDPDELLSAWIEKKECL